MPRQHPEPQQWPHQDYNVAQVQQQYIGGVPNIPPLPVNWGEQDVEQAGLQPRRRENREFTPDLWNEVQTLILELSDLKKKLIEKGVI